jgi:hypothetical protein
MAQLRPGQEATVMSPEDIGDHLTQPLPVSTPKQNHAWLLEHDEQYRIAFFANLKTRNTSNLRKHQEKTVLRDDNSGSVQGSSKEVIQPDIDISPGNDPDTTKNWNNNGRPTADGTNKSPWRTEMRHTSSGDSVSDTSLFPGSVSVTSQNWNNQPTDGGTDRLVSTDTWFTQRTKEAKDMVTKATKKIESGDVSAARLTDTSVQSDSSANACMQYAQRLAQRVSALSTEELRAIMDDVTYNAPINRYMISWRIFTASLTRIWCPGYVLSWKRGDTTPSYYWS